MRTKGAHILCGLDKGSGPFYTKLDVFLAPGTPWQVYRRRGRDVMILISPSVLIGGDSGDIERDGLLLTNEITGIYHGSCNVDIESASCKTAVRNISNTSENLSQLEDE